MTLCALLIVSVLISCEEASSDSDNTTEEAPGAIIANETPKRAATDVRDSYGIFTIKTDRGSYTDYHLAVKEASATAPTATEMASGALKRNISATEIHVLIAQRLNAPMVEFAKAYFADNTKQTLGTDMASTFLNNDRALGLIRDADATGTNAWVAESVLKSETEYTLYGMPDGGTEVSELLSFTTDAAFVFGSKGSTIDSTTSEIVLGVIDSTLEQGYITLSVRADEYYIFPMQTDITSSEFQIISFSASHIQDVLLRLNILIGINGFVSGVDSIFTDFLVMLVSRYTGDEYKKNFTAANYILMKPEKAQQLSSTNSWYYSAALSFNNLTKYHEFSTLSIQ